MKYENIKLRQEIKNEVKNVIEAEQASAAWKTEARARMGDVNALITAAKKVNKEITIDGKELLDEIRAELAAEAEEAAANEEPNMNSEGENA